MSLSFTRKKENFTCTICGCKVVGNGYTDHCPRCLWSKHLDVFPGDRKAECRGMMEPIDVEQKGESFRILYRCQKCGFSRWNKAQAEDSFEAIIEISTMKHDHKKDRKKFFLQTGKRSG